MPHRITTHRAANRPSIEDDPKRQADKAFYSGARWRRVRRIKLKTNPLCECGCRRASEEVHHKIDRRLAPELAYEISNLESLTKRCHSRITRERQLKGPN